VILKLLYTTLIAYIFVFLDSQLR